MRRRFLGGSEVTPHSRGSSRARTFWAPVTDNNDPDVWEGGRIIIGPAAWEGHDGPHPSTIVVHMLLLLASTLYRATILIFGYFVPALSSVKGKLDVTAPDVSVPPT